MSTSTFRYFVTDLDTAVAFYRDTLGFRVDARPSPALAVLGRDDLRLLLNVPGGAGAGTPAPDGKAPAPGGWNRLVLETPDLDATLTRLREHRVPLRTAPVSNAGFRHVVAEDPAGNPVELAQPPTG